MAEVECESQDDGVYNPSWPEVLTSTDWGLLRWQKERLIELLNDSPQSCSYQVPLGGLLHFIDAVQDAAAHELGEAVVFKSPLVEDSGD